VQTQEIGFQMNGRLEAAKDTFELAAAATLCRFEVSVMRELPRNCWFGRLDASNLDDSPYTGIFIPCLRNRDNR